MNILGIDPSKSKTGWAFWESGRHQSSIIAGSFTSIGESHFEAVDDFIAKLVPVIKQFKPDFVASEQQMANIKQHKRKTNNLAGSHEEWAVDARAPIILNRIAGSIQAICKGLHIPHEEVAPETWRKAFLGYGRKAGFQPDDYKRAAKAQCQLENITVKNIDQADAVGVVWWAGRCSQMVKQVQGRAA